MKQEEGVEEEKKEDDEDADDPYPKLTALAEG